MTRIVLRCTVIGGSSRAATSSTTCSGFSPANRGESPGDNDDTETQTGPVSSRDVGARTMLSACGSSTLLGIRTLTYQ
ncbi:hypothetical protein Afe04nite_21130 [Asanoa ferruginea]|nr:hypothetical protein Afe04nite_21130 [Asanoa ferruginea]